jgi:hypothetical protein
MGGWIRAIQTGINRQQLGPTMQNMLFNGNRAVQHQYSHRKQSEARMMGGRARR